MKWARLRLRAHFGRESQMKWARLRLRAHFGRESRLRPRLDPTSLTGTTSEP